ncbi:cytochrome P450 [Flagellimonas sp. HMM57]|uniref:cytochrome P450 n=1 Tax=unclassified Flagellimonas TaxID=2644544 RepID=UPI0013D678C2|nr:MULTISPECIES: cytochrome P450 [unclassified Flagellimonas]UII76974.1 cytochrome P450 [Flagellimonas sp. HMM57]
MKKLPHVSALKVLLNSKRILKNPLPFHYENFEKLGDTFRISILGEGKVLFSRDADLVKQVLQKKHRYYSKSKLQTKDLAKYIGYGLLTSEGEHWRAHRRMIQPAFHVKKLKGLFSIMRNTIVAELERIVPNAEQDVFALMGDLAFQVVAKSLFSSNDIREPMSRLQHITEENQKMLIREMRQPYFKWWYKASGEIGKHLNMAETGRNILNDLIEERLSSGKEEHDLLDMLLNATYEDGTKMPRRQLIDEVLILFTAGHETTANALAFTLYFISKDEELQIKLFEEISSLEKDDYTWEDLSKLSLTTSCIKEAMRLYPPAYFIDRVAIEDNEIDGLHMKKGTLVLLSIFELHRHKDFWENPTEYIPDRFMNVDMKEASNYYYPFGAGPRMCVGNAFANYEMVMVMVEIIKKYHISTKMPRVEINPMISLKPKEVKLNFVLR